MTRALLDRLVYQALGGHAPSREDARALLGLGDDHTIDVVAAAAKVRRQFFGRRVKLNFLVSMKSGICPEDCAYCSQRRGSAADVLKYAWLEPAHVVAAASRAAHAGSARICLVASGRGPTDRELERVVETVRLIRDAHPALEICACLGLLAPGQAERLRQSGVYAYNHNLNTSEERYGRICTTHTYADRMTTLSMAAEAGLSVCSGAIFGMGEDDDEVFDIAMALRAKAPDSVPVNFLMPFEGTPMERRCELTPQRCLRILALMRFMFPDAEVRIAGGREIHLRSLQPLALHIANSIFIGDYLTSEGQAAQADLEMIADAGFVVEGALGPAKSAGSPRPAPVLRRRGPGTTVDANA